MKFFVNSKISVLVIGFCAALLVGAGSAEADFTFGTPMNLGPPVNTGSFDVRPSISADGLSLYFNSNRPGGSGDHDIWLTTRATKDDLWGTPVNLGPNVNSSARELGPDISADGLELFFYRDYTSIWVARRQTKEEPWGEAVKLGPTVNSGSEGEPSISSDGLTLYFYSSRPGGYGNMDLWVTTRPTKDDPWGEALNLGPTVNSSAEDFAPSISANGLILFFTSSRPGGYGDFDIWVATRKTTGEDWGTPVNLGPLFNSSALEATPSISADGSTLFFWSGWPGGFGNGDIWQVPIIPIVDLNGDGIVDSADMCIMVDYWGTDESSCDIGPTPLGDGIVDVQDLIVLAEHLFEEIFPVELIGYWKLDEAQGDIAYDSVGDNDGILNGEPLWQPEGGIVAGAMEFDGIDDYVSTDFVLDPAAGAFSVVAWIKGGAPGQAIISQTDGIGNGETWLGADTLDGKLMTGLRPLAGRSPTPPMVSDFVITDGQWHHVGIIVTAYGVRNLYADGMRVASDTQGVELPSSDGGLYFGTGKILDVTSLFSGLIDDVRIYNVALSAEKIDALAH